MCAAILLWAGPNTIPRRYHPDRANRVLHSRHDPKLLRAECLPSASAAGRHPVLPASDKEWPGDKPRRPAGRRLAAVTLPSVQSDVMMIPARGEKCGRRSKALRQFKPKHIAIKSKRAFQVRHFQMHMTHPDIGMNCFRRHAVMSRHKRRFGKCSQRGKAFTFAPGVRRADRDFRHHIQPKLALELMNAYANPGATNSTWSSDLDNSR